MASKPTLTNAEWATNANISGSPIPGQDGLTTKDDPGLATRQAGGVPGRSIRARTLNFLLHQFYLWAAYLSDLHGSVDFLNKNYTWTGSHVFNGALTIDIGADTINVASPLVSDDYILANGASSVVASSGANGDVRARRNFDYCDSDGNATTRAFADVPVHLGEAQPYTDVGGASSWQYLGNWSTTSTAGVSIEIPLHRLLRPGCTIKKVQIGYTNASGAGASPVSFLLRRRVQSVASGAQVAATTIAASGGSATGTVSGAAQVISADYNDAVSAGQEWFIVLTSGDVAGALNWCAIDFDDPGPGVVR